MTVVMKPVGSCGPVLFSSQHVAAGLQAEDQQCPILAAAVLLYHSCPSSTSGACCPLTHVALFLNLSFQYHESTFLKASSHKRTCLFFSFLPTCSRGTAGSIGALWFSLKSLKAAPRSCGWVADAIFIHYHASGFHL